MNRWLAVLAVLAFGCTDQPAEPEAVDGTMDAKAKSAYIVTLANDAPPGLARKLAGHGMRHEFGAALNGFSANLTRGQANGLTRNPHVVSVEPMGVATLDARLPWGIDRIDERELTKKRDYNPASGGQGVTVYVIDSGVLLDHQEYAGRASFGFSITPEPLQNDHGTHVTGTAIGEMVGVAKAAKVVDVRVFVNSTAPWDDVIAGIDWVTANAELPAVANMSLQGEASDAVDQAVRNMAAAGILPVVAAGNRGNTACAFSPSRVAEAFVIGATDDSDTRASFSNHCGCVDLFAPGVSVRSSTFRTNRKGEFGYEYKSGTSMATPHAAGVVAIHLEQHPGTSPEAVHDALVATATPDVLDLNFSDELIEIGGPFCGAGGDTPNLLLFTEPGAESSACDKRNPKACK